jgi:hypothetical protein
MRCSVTHAVWDLPRWSGHGACGICRGGLVTVHVGSAEVVWSRCMWDLPRWSGHGACRIFYLEFVQRKSARCWERDARQERAAAAAKVAVIVEMMMMTMTMWYVCVYVEYSCIHINVIHSFRPIVYMLTRLHIFCSCKCRSAAWKRTMTPRAVLVLLVCLCMQISCVHT